jgi:hypothetical protein
MNTEVALIIQKIIEDQYDTIHISTLVRLVDIYEEEIKEMKRLHNEHLLQIHKQE